MRMLFGVRSIVVAILNIVWDFRNKNSAIFRFSRISLTALTMCAFYSQSSQWVIAEDWSALLDVVPTMSSACWILVIVSIVINGITLIEKK